MFSPPPPQDLPPGVELDGSLIAEYGSVLDGGVAERDGGRRLLALDLSLDLDELLDLPGLQVVARGETANSDSVSADVGDSQGLSNIEVGQSHDELADLYLQWAPEETDWWLAAGRMDANHWFGLPEHLGSVIQSSAAFSPTLVDFPSFPVRRFGLAGQAQFDGGLGITAGVFDRGFEAEGRVALMQIEHRSPDEQGRWALGAIWHGGDLPRVAGSETARGRGLYAFTEQRIDRNPERETWLVAQLGWGDPETSPLRLHAALGLQFEGLPGVLPGDTISAYASYVEAADSGESELALEAAWRVPISEHLALQPGLAWVQDPLGDPGADDATVFLLRLHGSF